MIYRFFIGLLLQVSPFFYISTEGNLDGVDIVSNFHRIGFWSVNSSSVNNMDWAVVLDSLSNYPPNSVIITLHKIKFLEDYGDKLVLLQNLRSIEDKLYSIQLGNEIDIFIEKTEDIDLAIGNYCSFAQEFSNLADSLEFRRVFSLSFSTKIFRNSVNLDISKKVVSALVESGNFSFSYVDFHNHGNWKQSRLVEDRIKIIKNIVEPLMVNENLVLTMSESSTWTNYGDVNFPKLNKQTEEQQADFLIKSALLAAAGGVRVICFGVLSDRLNFGKNIDDGRFRNNGLYYGLHNGVDERRNKVAVNSYFVLDSLFNMGLELDSVDHRADFLKINVLNRGNSFFAWLNSYTLNKYYPEIIIDNSYRSIERVNLLSGKIDKFLISNLKYVFVSDNLIRFNLPLYSTTPFYFNIK